MPYNEFPKSNLDSFKELVGHAFNEDLFKSGGDWTDYEDCVAEHWEDLMDIMRQEIYDRAIDHIENKQQKAKDAKTDPSLSAAERNPGLS